MKIATWNVARHRKGSEKTNAILKLLLEQDADILVLTETINSIDLGTQYKSFYSSRPIERYFRDDERRVAIYSKYDYHWGTRNR
jgi:exonuclease III